MSSESLAAALARAGSPTELLRNLAFPPSTFPVSRSELDEWRTWYEPPTPDELAPTAQPPFQSRVWLVEA